MKAETHRISLKPKGPLGRLGAALVRRLPPAAGRRAAKVLWRLGLLESV